jgi:hypothetical protein
VLALFGKYVVIRFFVQASNLLSSWLAFEPLLSFGHYRLLSLVVTSLSYKLTPALSIRLLRTGAAAHKKGVSGRPTPWIMPLLPSVSR